MRDIRLGDDIDDFCVRCKRVMNHNVVSVLNGAAAKVRCRTCYSDHDFRNEQPPPPKVDGYLKDGELLKLGDKTIRVLHTPGHSPGSISLSGERYVLTGDALFNQSISRTDLPGGDLQTLVQSIKERLFKLGDETIVYPGHGPETTIGDEKLANPFVGKAGRLQIG